MAVSNATCQHPLSSYWWWDPTWTDRQQLTHPSITVVRLWFFMRIRFSSDRLRGNLNGLREEGTSHVLVGGASRDVKWSREHPDPWIAR